MAFKVEIVNIDENFDNIILVSGLTIERLKIKYNWILNASVKNCILGEDDRGIVWYSGEWVCGEWIDGTWYSGIWHDGTWNNGKWYSYLIDKAMVISNRFVIIDKSNFYSEFRSGTWKKGDFYGGTFGYERNIDGKLKEDLINKTFISSYWLDGKFHDGLFYNSVWYNGIFYSGNMIGSYWLDGKFYSGTFDYHNPQGTINWYNGMWYGGDFVEGNWGNGNFDQININIKSRFGLANLSNSRTDWRNGNFYNGEFHSGLNLDASGNTLPSLNNSITHWLSGTFYGGKWYGGHFHVGEFKNGKWFGGVFNIDIGEQYTPNAVWYDGDWYNGLWINGIFYNGHFYDGMWLDGKFVSGYISTSTIENPLLPQVIATNVVPPVVITNSATTITAFTAIGNGRVTNNGGGTILDRGFCWKFSNSELLEIDYPTTGNSYHVSDGGAMGNISIIMNGLAYSSNYYYRTYARNIAGISYGNLMSFITRDYTFGIPAVITNPASTILSTSFIGMGALQSTNYPILEYGYIWTTGITTQNPLSGITVDANQGQISYDGSSLGLFGEFPIQSPITLFAPPGTSYWYRAYAVDNNNLGNPGYGSPVNFITPNTSPTIPVVETNIASLILYNSAMVSGQVIDVGNSTLIAVGVCYSLSSNPTISDSIVLAPLSTLPFNITLTGLLSNTTYHARSYATNGIGTGYGIDIIFTTTVPSSLPTVIMGSIGVN